MSKDTSNEYLFILIALLGLCAASLGHSYLYRKLRNDVDFLTVVAERRMTDV